MQSFFRSNNKVEETTKNISYKSQFIDSTKFMVSSSSNIISIFAEG